MYGSIAKGDETSESDVDLLVVGDIGLSDIAPLLRRLDLGRPVNPTVLSVAELRRRSSAKDRFVQTLVEGEKLFVLGSEDDLGEALEANRVEQRAGTRAELDELRVIVERSLKDAAVTELSAEGRFAMAYNAVRSLATMAIRASDYRVTAQGGAHHNTFLALEAAMGPAIARRAA